ncbi:MAG: hypothetical protein KA715_08610 [Xanthomonadaceae bacterium]|nr:hypothetical protein [Xanthomonadaceae bacterium]
MRVDAGLGWASIIWFVLFFLHFNFNAYAKTHECEEDRRIHCADYIPGDGKFTACMLTHEKELSKDCREEIARQKEERKKLYDKFYAQCETDLTKQCKGVEHSDGKALRCLGETLKRTPATAAATAIADSCKSSMEALRKRRLLFK